MEGSYRRSTVSLFCVTLMVLSLGLTVVLISASCQHAEFFEAAGIDKFNHDRQILLSSLAAISLVVVLALEISVYFRVSRKWRFHLNMLKLVWSSLMLLSWLISSTVNSLDWHHLVFLPDEARRQYINDVQVSVMRESYIVLIIASYANSIIWATLVYIYLRQVKNSSRINHKWLLIVIMCFTFGVNTYLIIHGHIVMHRNNIYLPYQMSSETTGTTLSDSYIVRSFTTYSSLSSTMEKQNCSWLNTKQNQKRREFCSKYFWYTDICRCDSPIDFEITPTKLVPNNIADVPVAIIASNRTRCLSRVLYHLMKADGANPSMTNVFLDGHFQEQIDVCKLFGVNFMIHDIHYSRYSKNTFRITEHYRISLTEMFNYYPTAHSIIILEDDLQVSPDFFSYFSQIAHLLDEDSSLYCISAWNDFGYQHSSKDPSLLYRVDTMPGLGWLLKRSLYKGELEAKWPSESDPLTWDLWMREPEQRKGRECIIPDVSRTFHFAPGTHIDLRQQKKYFSTRRFNIHREVKFKNLPWLTKDAYEQIIHQLIRSAKLVDHALTPCSKQLIPKTINEHYVIYLEHTDAVFIKLMKCFQLWDIDIRADHNNMWRFWHKENHIIVLRCPLSPYCIHIPSHISPLTESVLRIKLMFWPIEFSFPTPYAKRKWQQKIRQHILIDFYVTSSIILLAVCMHKLRWYLTKRVKHKPTSSGKLYGWL